MFTTAAVLLLAGLSGTFQRSSPPVRVHGDLSPIEAGLKASIHEDPRDIQTYFQLARVYEIVGHEDDAERTLRQALAATPRPPREAYERLFAHFRRLRQHDRAVPIAEAWVRHAPASPDPRVALAWLYLYHPATTLEQRLGFVALGLASADAALALSPGHNPAFEVKRQLLALKWIVSDIDSRAAVEVEQRALDRTFTPAPRVRRPAQDRQPWRTPLRALNGGTPLQVGGDLGEPARIAFVEPRYPEEAIRSGTQGTVSADVLIDVDGRVTDARISSSIPAMDAAVLESVRQWRYEPTLLCGRPVPVIILVRVEFVLTLRKTVTPASLRLPRAGR
jgi:TonB family protein